MARQASRTLCRLCNVSRKQLRKLGYSAFAAKRRLLHTEGPERTEGSTAPYHEHVTLERSFQQETSNTPVELLKAALLGPPRHLGKLGPSWNELSDHDETKQDRRRESVETSKIGDDQVQALKRLEHLESNEHRSLRRCSGKVQGPPSSAEHQITDPAWRHIDKYEPRVDTHRPNGVEIKTTSISSPAESADEELDMELEEFGSTSRAKQLRQIMRNQLDNCRAPRDILKVVAHAMLRQETAVEIPKLYETFQTALYRARQATSDPRILATINTIVWRFRSAGLPVTDGWLTLGLKFAARSRSLPAMKRYLQEHRDRKLGVTSNHFRSVIAKFSIGQRGLGEIRNGRWKKSELLQVLKGFPGLSEEKACHLEKFLDRDDWRMYHGWVAVLARCKAVDEMLAEWELWKNSELRASKRAVPDDAPFIYQSAKLRGDRWFIEQFCLAGEPRIAWQIFKESGMSFDVLKPPLSRKMLDHPEHATVWNDATAAAMMDKYAKDLVSIEKALGVQWVFDGTDGYHMPIGSDLQETLERLAEPNYFETFGYPAETEIDTLDDDLEAAVSVEDPIDPA